MTSLSREGEGHIKVRTASVAHLEPAVIDGIRIVTHEAALLVERVEAVPAVGLVAVCAIKARDELEAVAAEGCVSKVLRVTPALRPSGQA